MMWEAKPLQFRGNGSEAALAAGRDLRQHTAPNPALENPLSSSLQEAQEGQLPSFNTHREVR